MSGLSKSARRRRNKAARKNGLLGLQHPAHPAPLPASAFRLAMIPVHMCPQQQRPTPAPAKAPARPLGPGFRLGAAASAGSMADARTRSEEQNAAKVAEEKEKQLRERKKSPELEPQGRREHLRREPYAKMAFQLKPQHPVPLPASASRLAAGAAGPGVILGTAASAASIADARERAEKLNVAKIAEEKERQFEKRKKALEEKLKRYAYLNVSPGEKLEDSGLTLNEVRELQSHQHAVSAQLNEAKMAETEAKLLENQKRKLEEKIKRHSYLNTSPGNQLSKNYNGLSLEQARESQNKENVLAQQNATKVVVDNEKQLKIQRQKLEEKMKRLSFLNTSLGNKLCQDDSCSIDEGATSIQGTLEVKTVTELEPGKTIREIRLRQQKEYSAKVSSKPGTKDL